jgi:hypothetical protein
MWNRSSVYFAGGLLVATAATSWAQDYTIDPATMPGKARFFALAQEKFNQDPDAMFQTSRVDPGQRQAVFECGMKAVLADMPDQDAQRLSDMVEGRAAADPALAKWFQLEKTENPARHAQVSARAQSICPQFKDLMK